MTKRLFIGLSVLACLVYLCVPRITHHPEDARTTFERVARELDQIDADDYLRTNENFDALSDGC